METNLDCNLGQAWDVKAVDDESAHDVYLALKKFKIERLFLFRFLSNMVKLNCTRMDSSVRHLILHIKVCTLLRFNVQGEVVSKWSTFENKWLKMCPYKFDVTDIPNLKLQMNGICLVHLVELIPVLQTSI